MEDISNNCHNEQLVSKKNKYLKRKIPSSYIIVVLFFSFTLFIFAPYEIYFTNIDNFKFSVYDIISFTVLFFVSSFIGLFFIYQILFMFLKKISQFLLIVLFGTTFAFYIQGNYLRTDYGVLNGEQVDWSLYTKDGVVSVLFWIFILGGLIFVLLKYGLYKCEKTIITVSVCVVLVQIVTLTIVGITSDGFKVKREYVTTTEKEFSMSSSKNLVVLILDTFDSRVFNEMVETEKGNYYKDMLEDFTYYRNTTGMYAYTDLAIPFILSGKEYKNEEDFGDYVEEAYGQSDILHHLAKNDWLTSVYTTTNIPQHQLDYNISNIKNVELTVSSHRKLASYLYSFVGYRYLPFQLKKFCWFYPDDINNLISIKDSDLEFFEWSNYYFDWDMPAMTADEKKNTFHFYHLEGTHIPFTMNADFSGSDSETSIADETKGIMVLVNKYIKLLKEKGIYDNTAIVILGDHGFLDRRQCPVLLVKGIRDSKDFEVSDIPVSFADLQSTYIALSDGKSGSDLYVESEQNKKNRFFYSYDINEETGKRKADIDKFEITGDSFDDESMKKLTK